jgi:CheY-like chemotaxis protein
MSSRVIAVIEDDPILSKILHESLVDEGFEVQLAYDGEEGLRIIRESTPVVILLDILMPRKNGFEVLEILRHDPQTKNIPVIVLTMLNADDNLQKALSLGATDYIVKSQHAIEEIVEKVKNIASQNMLRM